MDRRLAPEPAFNIEIEGLQNEKPYIGSQLGQRRSNDKQCMCVTWSFYSPSITLPCAITHTCNISLLCQHHKSLWLQFSLCRQYNTISLLFYRFNIGNWITLNKMAVLCYTNIRLLDRRLAPAPNNEPVQHRFNGIQYCTYILKYRSHPNLGAL